MDMGHAPVAGPLASKHSESVPELEMHARDTDSDSSSSPPLSRTQSYTSQGSASSSRESDEWEIFPPLEKLNVFELLDSLALPQRLEKLNRTVSSHREKLKQQTEKATKQYVTQREKVLKKRDMEVRRIRERYGDQMDKMLQRWNDAKVVSAREKFSFVAGVTNIFVTGYLMGGYPDWVHVWYSLQMLYFMPVRYYTYHKRGYHYFLADLCYFTNVLLLLSLYVFPNSRRLMISTYCLAYGNNAWAIAMWRNSLVFHSLDKVTSLFIHLMPPVVLHSLVHLASDELLAARFPAIGRVKTTDQYNLLEMIGYATIPYLIWQVLYHVLITVRRRDKIAAGRPTSFTWLRKSYSKAWIGKMVLRLPTESLQVLAFMLIQYSYAVVTMLPCPLWFYHRPSSAVFIAAISLWSVFNGATYYIDVFGKRFQKELEELRRESREWRESPQMGAELPPAAVGERRESIGRLAQLDDEHAREKAEDAATSAREGNGEALRRGEGARSAPVDL